MRHFSDSSGLAGTFPYLESDSLVSQIPVWKHFSRIKVQEMYERILYFYIGKMQRCGKVIDIKGYIVSKDANKCAIRNDASL